MIASDELKVLETLGSFGDEQVRYAGCCADDLGMEKAQFLRHCRSLRDMGLVRITSLWDFDWGTCAGSAYVRTGAGNALLKSFERAA